MSSRPDGSATTDGARRSIVAVFAVTIVASAPVALLWHKGRSEKAAKEKVAALAKSSASIVTSFITSLRAESDAVAVASRGVGAVLQLSHIITRTQEMDLDAVEGLKSAAIEYVAASGSLVQDLTQSAVAEHEAINSEALLKSIRDSAGQAFMASPSLFTMMMTKPALESATKEAEAARKRVAATHNDIRSAALRMAEATDDLERMLDLQAPLTAYNFRGMAAAVDTVPSKANKP